MVYLLALPLSAGLRDFQGISLSVAALSHFKIGFLQGLTVIMSLLVKFGCKGVVNMGNNWMRRGDRCHI